MPSLPPALFRTFSKASVLGPILAVTLAAAPLLAQPAAAQNQSPPRQAQQGEPAQNAETRAGETRAGETQAEEAPRPVIGAAERRIIRGWYGSTRTGFRPLPPDVTRTVVERNGMVPRQLRDRVQPLPQALLERLPEHPNMEYGRLGSTIILRETDSGIVRDVMRDAT